MLYTNYFLPSMMLIEKMRNGGNVRKKYDKARMPYRRVLESGIVPEQAKEDLKQAYVALNAMKLNREVNRLQDRLDTLARSKHKAEKNVNLEYIST